MILNIVLSLLVAFLSFALLISIRFNLKHGVIILNVEDQIQDSLDTLDSCHRAIDSVTQRNLVNDDPNVREVHKQLKNAKRAVLQVANKLAHSLSEKNEESEQDAAIY